MASVDFGPTYNKQLDDERRRLKSVYGQEFEPVFDSSVGTFVLISADRTISQAFYPQDNQSVLYPAYQPSQLAPSKATTAAPGYGVLRVEHIGLPEGYNPTTVIDGQFGTNSTIENFDSVDPNLLAQYPQNIRDDINSGFRHLPNNRTQGRGLPYVVYPNERIVQAELPMGGPIQFGYRITVQNVVSTPFGDFGFYSPWEGTSGGGQALVNPQPGLLHTVRIRWNKIERIQNDLERINTPTTDPRPTPLPTPPLVPPIIQQEIRRVQILQADGLRPQFIPSTMSQPPATGQLPNPFVKLVKPFADPQNTFRARNVTELYSFSPNAASYQWIYEIGRPPSIKPLQYKFRNNTVNAVLRFQFYLPEWAETESPTLIDMDPQSEIVVTIRLKESDAKNKSTMNSRTFSQKLEWFVSPLNVSGPIYVLRNLPPLITINPPPKQDPQLNSPQPPVVLPVGGNSVQVLGSNAKIYAQISPPRASMVVGERMPIQFAIYAGPPDVTPNATNSKQLLFPVNGVIWKSLNQSVAVIDSPNGSVDATLVAINPGIIEINAEIVAPPTNIPLATWQNAYNNGVAGVNVSAKKTINNFQGILAGGTVRVVTSRSQLR
jgi:hypothetical protein